MESQIRYYDQFREFDIFSAGPLPFSAPAVSGGGNIEVLEEETGMHKEKSLPFPYRGVGGILSPRSAPAPNKHSNSHNR